MDQRTMEVAGGKRTAGGRPFRWMPLVALSAVLGVLSLGASAAEATSLNPFIGSLTKPTPTEKGQPSSGFSEEVCGTYFDPATGLLYVADPGAEVLAKKGELTSSPSIEILKVSGAEATDVQRIDGSKIPGHTVGCQIAVNDKTGEVYVADETQAGIFAFNKAGEFEKAKSIFNPKRGAGFKAKEKEEGEELGEERLSVAVNESTGDLYVGDGPNEQVYIFDENGAPIGTLAYPGETHEPAAITVNQSTGQIYVATEEVPPPGADEEENSGEFPVVIDIFEASGKFEKQINGSANGPFPGFGAEGEEPASVSALATGPKGELYVADPFFSSVFEFSAAGTYMGAITGAGQEPLHEPVGVAVDKSGDVYVADKDEAEPGSELELPGHVDVFGPSETGTPVIESSSVADVTATSATLEGEINQAGEAVTYFFEVCTGSPASCVDEPSAAGEGLSAAEGVLAVSVPLSDLKANTPYTYKLVVHYGGGKVLESSTGTFTTQTEGVGLQLPDGRSWEMVSPEKNHGASYESLTRSGGDIQAATDGDGLTYVSLSPPDEHPEGSRNPAYNQLLAHRVKNASGEAEWSTADISIPGERAVGVISENDQEYLLFSPDLNAAYVHPLEFTNMAEPPLALHVTERTDYVRHNGECPGESCFVPLLTSEDDTTGQPWGTPRKGPVFGGATPDLSHVLLRSPVPLTSQAGELSSLYEWTASAPVASRLQLVSVLPGSPATPATHAFPPTTYLSQAVRHAISEDGSRVVWVSGQGKVGEEELFSRDMATGETVKLNKPEEGVVSEAKVPEFSIASPDGTKVFFTDEQRLTANSTASRTRPDLYEYDLATNRLQDVAPDPHFASEGESTAVRGVVLGINEEGEHAGSTVYFVANGVLSGGSNPLGETATPGNCADNSVSIPQSEIHPEHHCNVYVDHLESSGEWGTPDFVASVSEADIPDWRPANHTLANMTSRVSPNGSYLAFMSERSLTGYDNRDAAPGAGGVPDEEVFLYKDQTEGAPASLTCVSCNPTGSRPHGVYEHQAAGEGLGLVVDRRETWEGRWLDGSLPGWTASSGQWAFYQSHYLTDSGRLFFDAADALVPAVTTPTRPERTVEGKTEQVGVENVYEYEPSGIGSCAEGSGCVSLISSGSSPSESAFLDASADGNDVFFLTSSALVPPDTDGSSDVYDARVCGDEGCIAYHTSTTTTCASGIGCHGEAPAAPTYAPPATVASSGNLSVLSSKTEKPSTTTKPTPKPLTRAQKLKRALRACHKIKKKKKRQVCERTARKRYGPKKKSSKKAKKSAVSHRRPA
jgi:hypothetical protein